MSICEIISGVPRSPGIGNKQEHLDSVSPRLTKTGMSFYDGAQRSELSIRRSGYLAGDRTKSGQVKSIAGSKEFIEKTCCKPRINLQLEVDFCGLHYVYGLSHDS